MKTDDRRIAKTRPLLTPAILAEEVPISERSASTVQQSRDTIEAIIDGRDPRLLVVVGPCSIHDLEAAREYGQRLRAIAETLADKLVLVMRVYFEKPRTVIGWKGLIHDPNLDESFQINRGLRLARSLLVDLTEMGLPVGTEFLDTTFGQFYAELVSWGAIGARTTESQIHRELASGLSMAVGFKNRTDGDVQVAVDAIAAAARPHLFPSLTKEGAPAILETTGNSYGHLILRGGTETGPNYDAKAVDAARDRLEKSGVRGFVMVDASHGNSQKDPQRQPEIAREVIRLRGDGRPFLGGLMIESHLVAGRQDLHATPLRYGQSVTDACLGFEETEALLRELADGV